MAYAASHHCAASLRHMLRSFGYLLSGSCTSKLHLSSALSVNDARVNGLRLCQRCVSDKSSLLAGSFNSWTGVSSAEDRDALGFRTRKAEVIATKDNHGDVSSKYTKPISELSTRESNKISWTSGSSKPTGRAETGETERDRAAPDWKTKYSENLEGQDSVAPLRIGTVHETTIEDVTAIETAKEIVHRGPTPPNYRTPEEVIRRQERNQRRLEKRQLKRRQRDERKQIRRDMLVVSKKRKHEERLIRQQTERDLRLEKEHEAVLGYFAEADKVLIAVDMDLWERSNDIITELGIAVWDLRESTSVDAKFTLLKHLVVKENIRYRNGTYVPNDTPYYDFGTSEIMPFDDCTVQIRALMDKYGDRAVFVGHSVHADGRMMRRLGHRIGQQIPRIETISLWRYHAGGRRRAALDHALEGLEIPYMHLHNAGNEAYYTMRIVQQIYGTDENGQRKEFKALRALKEADALELANRTESVMDGQDFTKRKPAVRYMTRHPWNPNWRMLSK
ncbi:uncharacterized protein V1518DRAFT_456566 [Limtongia smithiae]|uniref:uncharacterized protein n=1 Tax=Limtongia smithiae TaxID=1125753 RepID=UPI0034CDD7C9